MQRRAQCTWREMPLLWTCAMTYKCSCLDRGEKRRFMYVKRGCVNKEVTEREDAARPCGNLFWLSEQPSAWGAYCLLGGKEGIGRYLGKRKEIKLRKRAIKSGTSWHSEKYCGNNSVSTQLLASDVSWSNGNLSTGGPTADLWPQRLGNHDSCR